MRRRNTQTVCIRRLVEIACTSVLALVQKHIATASLRSLSPRFRCLPPEAIADEFVTEPQLHHDLFRFEFGVQFTWASRARSTASREVFRAAHDRHLLVPRGSDVVDFYVLGDAQRHQENCPERFPSRALLANPLDKALADPIRRRTIGRPRT